MDTIISYTKVAKYEDLIELPDCDEDGGIDVIWHEGSYVKVDSYDNTVVISANNAGLRSLGEQMIYLSQSNIINGVHIHFDDFFLRLFLGRSGADYRKN